tara:strand:- start:205 stop:492 length:288 start_codon:yes stop_codon:yes gene_type:complete
MKKKKEKKSKIEHIYRTIEERKNEVRKIKEVLDEHQLSIEYEPIKKLYNIMFNYIKTGERIIVNIPFPEINKRIEGVLAVNIREEVALRLKYEKF